MYDVFDALFIQNKHFNLAYKQINEKESCLFVFYVYELLWKGATSR